MTLEENLKNLILTKYRSIRDFSLRTGIPCSTVNGIINRGVNNSSVSNVIKMCQALGISADELAKGRITPAQDVQGIDLLEFVKMIQMNNPVLNCTIGGQPISSEDAQYIIDSIDVAVQIINKRHQRA